MTNEPNQTRDNQSDQDDPNSDGDERKEARAAEPTRRDADAPSSQTGSEEDTDADKETVEAEQTASLREESSEADEDEEQPMTQADFGLTVDEDERREPADEEPSAPAQQQEAEQEEQEPEEQQEQEPEEEEPEEEEPEPQYTDLEEQGEGWLAELFERMSFDAEAEYAFLEDRPHFDISGPDADRLLGPGKLGPKAIEGIETLMQSVFSTDDDASKLYLDVSGKRAARKEMLQRVADDMADTAVQLDKKLTISGLNSTERRIIHRQLRDYDGVRTESVGDGIFRRLMIEPTND